MSGGNQVPQPLGGVFVNLVVVRTHAATPKYSAISISVCLRTSGVNHALSLRCRINLPTSACAGIAAVVKLDAVAPENQVCAVAFNRHHDSGPSSWNRNVAPS